MQRLWSDSSGEIELCGSEEKLHPQIGGLRQRPAVCHDSCGRGENPRHELEHRERDQDEAGESKTPGKTMKMLRANISASLIFLMLSVYPVMVQTNSVSLRSVRADCRSSNGSINTSAPRGFHALSLAIDDKTYFLTDNFGVKAKRTSKVRSGANGLGRSWRSDRCGRMSAWPSPRIIITKTVYYNLLL
jgi:hypothetical protein